jgi:hypothetical protein
MYRQALATKVIRYGKGLETASIIELAASTHLIANTICDSEYFDRFLSKYLFKVNHLFARNSLLLNVLA